MNYGLELKLERVRRGLTQMEACKRMGLTIHSLIDIERGRVTLSKPDFDRFVLELDSHKKAVAH